MCKQRLKGRRVFASKNVCVNYCSFKQDKQDEDDEGGGGGGGEDEDEDIRSLKEKKDNKYQDAPHNQERKMTKCSSKRNSLSSVKIFNLAKMSRKIIHVALVLIVIYLFESSHFVLCDKTIINNDNLMPLNNSSLEEWISKLDPKGEQAHKTKQPFSKPWQRSTRGANGKRWPLYVAKQNENVELGCHMFGAPLRLNKDRKWLLAAAAAAASRSLNNANNDPNNEETKTFSSSFSSSSPSFSSLFKSDENDKKKQQQQQQQKEAATYDLTTFMPQGNLLSGNKFQDNDGIEGADADEELEEAGEGGGGGDQVDVYVDDDDQELHSELFGSEDDGGSTLTDMMMMRSQSNIALNEQDLVSIIFWFKDDNPIPIYTLDARQTQINSLISSSKTNSEQELDKSRRFNNNNNTLNHYNTNKKTKIVEDNNGNKSEFGKIMQTNMQLLSGARHYQGRRGGGATNSTNRNNPSLKLDPISSFPVIKLIIEGAGPQDSGDYKCRVDFRRSSTISQIVRLLVEAPISKVEISIAKGNQEEGDNVVKSGNAFVSKPISLAKNVIQSGQSLLYSSSSSAVPYLSPPGVLLDESEPGEFICSVAEGSPPPTLTWFVSWPTLAKNQQQQQQQQQEQQQKKDLEIVWTEPILASSQLGISVETAHKSELVRQNLAASSKLSIARLERQYHRARFKCQAKQRSLNQQLTPTTRNISSPTQRSYYSTVNSPKTGSSLASYSSPSSINYRQSSSPSTSPSASSLPSIKESLSRKENSQNGNSSNVILVTSSLDNDTNKLRSRQSVSAGRGKVQKQEQRQQQQQQRQRDKLAMIDDFSKDSFRGGKNNELSEWFELHLNLKPKHIEIVSDLIRAKEPTLIADQQPIYLAEVNEFESVKFVCSSSGSNPAAQIEWHLRESNGQVRNLTAQAGLHKMTAAAAAATTTTPNNNNNNSSDSQIETTSSSSLELHTIDHHYHRAELICRAINENLSTKNKQTDNSNASLSARVKLSVKFKPIVRLVDAYNNNNNNLKEANREEWNQKRRLKCLVQSNPPINQLVWLVNEQPLAKIMAPTNSKIHFLADGASSTQTNNKVSAQKRPLSGQAIEFGERNARPMPSNSNNNNNMLLLPDDDTISESWNGIENEQSESTRYIVPNDEWTLIPQLSSAIDESKYKFHANSLTVMNSSTTELTSVDETTKTTTTTTTTDRDQIYKCLAINALGQTTSTSSFRFSHNYAPSCVRKLRRQEKEKEEEESSIINKNKYKEKEEEKEETNNVFDLNLDSTSQVNDLEARFSCNVQANPKPFSFVWSFVPLEKVTKLIAQQQQQQQAYSINNLPATFSTESISESEAEAEQAAFIRKLQNFANFHIETKSNEINYKDLINNSSIITESRPLGGVLFCYAHNQVGKQLKPCLNLLLPPDLNEPDAGNCTVQPVVEPRISEEGQSKSVVIGVDCSKARDSNQLLFQLSISRNGGQQFNRNSNSNGKRGGSEDHTNLNTRKLLFAQSKPITKDQQTKGDEILERSQFSISDIIEWDNKILALNVTTTSSTQSDETKDDVTQNDQGFNMLARTNSEESSPDGGELLGGNGGAKFGLFFPKRTKTRTNTRERNANSRFITLDEQVDLLKELVFTIRASNLIKTSAPHAIYGSELKLIEADSFNNQTINKILSPISNHSITGSTQVSRSTTNQLDNSFEDSSSMNSQITLHSSILNSNISTLRQNNNRQPLAAGNNLQNIPITNWIHHNEISITIAAIFATAILSLLTLTLIILVLKSRKEAQNHTVCVIDERNVDDNVSLASHTTNTNNRVKVSRPIIANESVELKEGVFFDGNSMMRFKAFNSGEQNHLIQQQSNLDLGWKTLQSSKYLSPADNIKLDETTSYIEGIDFLAPAVCNGGNLKVAHQEATAYLDTDINKQPALIYAPSYQASTSTSPPQLQAAAIYSGSSLSLSQLEDQTTTLLTATGTTTTTATTTSSQHRTAPTVVDCNHHHGHSNEHNLELDSDIHTTRCDNMYLFSFF